MFTGAMQKRPGGSKKSFGARQGGNIQAELEDPEGKKSRQKGYYFGKIKKKNGPRGRSPKDHS